MPAADTQAKSGQQDRVTPDEAGGAGDEALPFPASLAEIERAAAVLMVERCGGNKSEAAKALGVSRKHLYVLLRGAETR